MKRHYKMPRITINLNQYSSHIIPYDPFLVTVLVLILYRHGFFMLCLIEDFQKRFDKRQKDYGLFF